MRKFSDKEKLVIGRLVDGASQSFTYLPINAYDDIFYRERVEFVYQPKSELRFYSQQGSLRDSDEIFKVTSDIYEISYLIDYLEKEGLIRHFSVGTGQQSNNIAGFNKAGLTAISVELDPAVGEMLYSNLNYPIYVTQTLISLVQENFRTFEDQSLDEARIQTHQAKRQSVLSLLAVVFAMLTFLFSLFQGCNSCSRCTVLNDSISKEMTISVMGIVNYMKNNIENKLDVTMNNTTNIRMMLNDTIAVHITGCPCIRKRVPTHSVDSCHKRILINTCQDTVVSKKYLKLK